MIAIDAGHGGIDKDEYTTKGAKQYHFDNGAVAYEGVINRTYAERLEMYLDYFKIPYVRTYHPYHDLSLSKRVMMIPPDCKLFISLHNNAASASIKGPGSKAFGTEIFTTKGDTKADPIAEDIVTFIREELPQRRIRASKSDGTKEADFYVIRKAEESGVPGVLCEFGFFDNYQDFKYITDFNNIDKFCFAISKAIKHLYDTN